ncbi:MAG: cell division protein FtsQ/DivIB [Planctomycetota bacterium]|jgi:hypothetical protein
MATKKPAKKKKAKKPAKKKAGAKSAGGRPWALAGLGGLWTGIAAAGTAVAAGAVMVTHAGRTAVQWEVAGRRPAVLGLATGAVLGVLALCVTSVNAALPAATGPATLRLLGEPPAWIPKDWAAGAAEAAEGPLYRSGRVAAVGRALTASPWVARVEAVQRTEIGLVAKIAFRTPHYLVSRGGRTVVLDAEGVVMPPLPGGLPRTLPVVRLRGINGAAPAPGEQWRSGGVAAAIGLGRKLFAAGHGVVPRVSALSVRRAADRYRVDLHTVDGGGHIEWGIAGGGPYEVPEEARLRHLVDVLNDVQSFKTVKVAKLWTKMPIIVDK